MTRRYQTYIWAAFGDDHASHVSSLIGEDVTTFSTREHAAIKAAEEEGHVLPASIFEGHREVTACVRLPRDEGLIGIRFPAGYGTKTACNALSRALAEIDPEA